MVGFDSASFGFCQYCCLRVLSARRFTRLPLVEPEWIAGCRCWNTAALIRVGPGGRWSWFSVAKPSVFIGCSRQRRTGTQPSLCKIGPERSKVTHSASSTHGRNNIFTHNTPPTHPIPSHLHHDASSLHPADNYLLMWLISFYILATVCVNFLSFGHFVGDRGLTNNLKSMDCRRLLRQQPQSSTHIFISGPSLPLFIVSQLKVDEACELPV